MPSNVPDERPGRLRVDIPKRLHKLNIRAGKKRLPGIDVSVRTRQTIRRERIFLTSGRRLA